jgi:spore maturation protein CgeB
MKPIRFLKASPLYHGQMMSFRLKHPDHLELSYADLLQAYMNERFIWSDSWKRALEKNQKFEVMEVISNVPELGLKWAKERGLSHEVAFDPKAILMDQIEFFKPDILFAHDYFLIDSRARNEIRNRFPYIKCIICWDGIAHNSFEFYKDADLILSCIPETAQFYKEKGYYFKNGFDASLVDLASSQRTHRANFIGSLDLNPGFHTERLELLGRTAFDSRVSIHLSSFNTLQGLKGLLGANSESGTSKLDQILNFLKIALIKKHELYGLEMYNTLGSCLVTLNSHIRKVGQSAANMRLFEATGMGSCLITDFKHNLREFLSLKQRS